MIEAQEQLKSISASQYIHEKQSDKKKIHKDLFEKAYPFIENKKKNVVTQEDLNKILGIK